MEQPSQFRASFNGFNRQDVVRYMEFINNKHTAQVAQLTHELEYLRGKQDTLDAGRVSQLEKDLSAAQTENATLRQRVAELEKQLASTPAAASSESELEAYRRAERVERTARERARQLTEETAQALEQASGQLEGSAGELSEAAARLSELLSGLQGAVDAVRSAVRSSADAVQASAKE